MQENGRFLRPGGEKPQACRLTRRGFFAEEAQKDDVFMLFSAQKLNVNTP